MDAAMDAMDADGAGNAIIMRLATDCTAPGVLLLYVITMFAAPPHHINGLHVGLVAPHVALTPHTGGLQVRSRCGEANVPSFIPVLHMLHTSSWPCSHSCSC